MNQSVTNEATPIKEQLSIVKMIINDKKATPVAKVAPAKQQEPASTVTRTCAVLGCENHKTLPDSAFFSFPEEASLRSVWTEVTGRSGWTPNDFSYVCSDHFTPDSLGDGELAAGAVPTLKLPHHVMEVEYIDEEMLKAETGSKESETEHEALELGGPRRSDSTELGGPRRSSSTLRLELLKLFTRVQNNQNQIVNLKKRLQHDRQVLKTRNRTVRKLQERLKKKQKLLRERNELKNLTKESNQVLVMPTRYTEDIKNLSLNIYSYSAEAYIYLRNTLKTALPSTEILEEWLESGYRPKRIMSNSDCLKVVTEAKPTELSCKVSIV